MVNRIATILYLEGDELLADNILMQCQDLDQSGRKLLNNQREILANKCIEKYSWISSGVVLINPLPGIDLLAVAAINTQMILMIVCKGSFGMDSIDLNQYVQQFYYLQVDLSLL